MSNWTQQTTLIPTGSQTISKTPAKYVEGVYPRMLRSGDGCVVTDLGGNLYTDFIGALGPVILGYNSHPVNKAVIAQINTGAVSMSFPHTLEYTLADSLLKARPGNEMSRFFKTGSDALSAAVRVARAFTGKNRVVVCGYHGWHDWYAVSTDRPAGIPNELKSYISHFKYNDPQSLADLFTSDDIAAVILEPVMFDAPKDGFLDEVARLAHEHDALLVFDEVVTGFRFGLGGAAAYFKQSPDLVCYSKAMGNGFPIAALSGRIEVMETFERDDVFISGTFGGELTGIAAAIATMAVLRMDDEEVVRRIWQAGQHLKDGFNTCANFLDIPVKANGFAPRTEFVFPTIEHKALFWQECAKRGVLFGYSNFISAAHRMSAVDAVLNVVEGSLRYVKEHWDAPLSAMEGKVPTLTFKKS